MAGRILPDHEYSLTRELFRQIRRGQYGIIQVLTRSAGVNITNVWYA